MSLVQRVSRNTAVLIVGRISDIITSVFVGVFLARYLGSADFGNYNLIYAHLSFFAFLASFGIRDIVVREISKDNTKAEELIGNGLSLSIVLSICAIGAAWAISYFLGYTFNIRLLIYIASLNILFAPWNLYVSIFQVHLQQKHQVMVEVTSKFILLSLVLILIFMKALLIHFILVNLLAGGIVAIGNRFFSRRFIRPRWQVDMKIWLALLKESWPIALTGFFICIYNRIDQIMLYKMKVAELLGYYAAAVKLTEMFNIIPAAFMASVYPLLSKYFVTSNEKLEKVYRLSFKYLSTLIIPIAVGISILSEPIITLIYGKQFLNSVAALRILIWSEIFTFLGAVHVSILIAVGLQRLDFIFTSSAAIVNILLNLLLIPRFGIVGAAVATVISYSIGVPLSCALKRTRRYGMALLYSMLRPLVAATIMGCLTYFAFHLHLPLILNISFSVIIYFGAILLINGLDREDLGYFISMITSYKRNYEIKYSMSNN